MITNRRKHARRSFWKFPALSLQLLEGRDLPAAIIVDPSFNSSTPGWQVTAFDKVSDALTAATAVDTVDVNAGDYSADTNPSILDENIPLTFQGAAKLSNLAATTGSIILNADLTVGDATNTTINAPISGGGGLVKIGSGRITLSESNTFSGLTTVSQGVLAISQAAALGAKTAGTVVQDGAALELSGGITVTEPITLTGSGISNGGALRSTSGTNTWSGVITLDGTGARINADAAGVLFTVSGQVDGLAKALTLGGAGDITVSGLINTGVGGTIIKDGNGKATLGNALNNFAAVDATSVVITILGGILSHNGESSGSAGAKSTSGIIPAVTVPSYVYIDGGTIQGTRVGVGVTWLATPKGITLGPNGGKFEVTDTTSGNLNIYSGVVSGTSGGAFIRVGAGGSVLSMAGASTYDGPTIVQGGILRVRTTPNRFPINTDLFVNSAPGTEFNLNGVNQQVGSIAGNGSITLGSATLTIGGSTSKNFSGVISGTGQVKYIGTGTQTFSGASTYSGATTISSGTALLGNTTGGAFGTATPTTTVAAAGTIGSVDTANAGILLGPLNLNGTLAPGDSGKNPSSKYRTGILTVGNITFGATSIFTAEINGTTPGIGDNGYDRLVVNGTLTLNDGAKLNFVNTGTVSAVGDKFMIIENKGTSTFSTFFRDMDGNTLGQNALFTSDGQLFRITYTGGDGNDVVITRIAPFTIRYVSPTFTSGTITDADPVAPGDQTATVGTTAFSTIMAAISAASPDDRIVVNAGNYSADPAVNLGANSFELVFQEDAIIIPSLAGSNTATLMTLGTKVDGITGITLTLGGNNSSTTFAGSIGGPGGIIKEGTGTFTLSPLSNSYFGPTTVKAGNLKAGSSGAFSANSPYDIAAGSHLILNGFSNAVGNLAGSGIVENDGATNAILTAGSSKIADGSTFDLTFTGTLTNTTGSGTGALGFIKVGSGKLSIPAVNNFTGPFGLLGGVYEVADLPSSGTPGPFGASTNAAANFSIGGSATLRYTGNSKLTFDRNITWGPGNGTIDFIDPAADVTLPGVIVPNSPGTFVKAGPGRLAFTNAEAFQTANTPTAYGKLATGNITVSGGELAAVDLRVNGLIASRSGGSRSITISTGATLTTTGTIFVDPSNSYLTPVAGPGTLKLRNPAASKTSPNFAYDVGPAGGDGVPFGSAISAVIDFGDLPAVFVGKANRNDVGRHSGDLRFEGQWIASDLVNVQFMGLTALAETGQPATNKHNMHYVMNQVTNPDFKGAVRIANADLALTKPAPLSAQNSVTFNSFDDSTNTTNRAAIFLYGRNVTIGSLNDVSAANTTAFIRNGARATTNGGTGTSSGNALGVDSDSVLEVVQSVNGSFTGVFADGPNDRGALGDTGIPYRKLSLVMQGDAKLTLSGTSTLTNNVDVNLGTMIQNGSFTGPLAVNVASTANLGGAGTIKAPTSVSGGLFAATKGTTGVLTITGDLTLFNTTTVSVDIQGLGVGTGYDQIAASGNISLNDAKLDVTSTISPGVASGKSFVIINNTGTNPISSTFFDLAEGKDFTAGGTKYTITYQGGDGNDVVLTAASTTPAVTGFIVNNGNPQRSRITTIEVTFAGSVDATAFTGLGAITLTRFAATPSGTVGTVVQTGATGANGRVIVAQGAPNSLVLTFDNADSSNITAGVEYGSLADGRWQLAIPAASFISVEPIPPTPPQLRRLFGDFDNNGTVDGADFANFGIVFGTNALASDAFNYDANTTIDGADFSEFGARIGLTL